MVEKLENPKQDQKLCQTFFFYKMFLFKESFLAIVKVGSDSGYVQCDFVVPDGIKTKLATFLQIFKKICIWNNRYRILFGTYATENEMLIHPQ